MPAQLVAEPSNPWAIKMGGEEDDGGEERREGYSMQCSVTAVEGGRGLGRDGVVEEDEAVAKLR